MDVVHLFQAPELKRIQILETFDSVHLVLLYGNSQLHLRKFTRRETTNLLEIVELRMENIYQFDVFFMDSQWHIFLSGSRRSYIYRFQG